VHKPEFAARRHTQRVGCQNSGSSTRMGRFAAGTEFWHPTRREVSIKSGNSNPPAAAQMSLRRWTTRRATPLTQKGDLLTLSGTPIKPKAGHLRS
jgi:hypothetical protein